MPARLELINGKALLARLNYKKAGDWLGGMTIWSSKWQSEFDCKNQRHRGTAILFYAGRGGNGATVHKDFDQDKWEPVPPDTQIADLWKFACGRR